MTRHETPPAPYQETCCVCHRVDVRTRRGYATCELHRGEMVTWQLRERGQRQGERPAHRGKSPDGRA